MLTEGQATGALVPDAHLAALAIEHGATICTTDGDVLRPISRGKRGKICASRRLPPEAPK